MRFLLVVSVLLGVAALCAAQKPEIKTVPIRPAPAGSGQAMFSEYCAVCHGKDGKGSGPAAPALKVPASDLTTLSKRNGGTFPSAHVSNVIRLGGDVAAHGSKDMLMWGHAFWTLTPHSAEIVQLRIANLTNYIKSLQEK
ncbi:MAG: cytochrome c [Candidatus Sulfotelmatobacter sp.]